VVHHYAVNALEAGIHGIICSAIEAEYIKKKISLNLLCVTPAIRMNNNQDDHMRVATPKIARINKVDFIVVGRPITLAKDPVKTYHLYRREFLGE
jgi:orotidine-5'-phosphate decarboxylase